MKIQKSMTLDPELVDWLSDGVEAGKFPHLSGGVEHAIRSLREYESPEATARRREAEERLRDAEKRARRAEAAIEMIEKNLGVPIDEIAQRLDMLVDRCEESFQSIRKDLEESQKETNRALGLATYYVGELTKAEAELFELRKAQKAEAAE